MSTQQKTEPLVEGLERLERHLELPHVSGELSSWSDEALRLLCEVDGFVREAVANEHPKSFDAIRKNQPNLLAQVEKLRADDAQVLATLEAVIRRAEQFEAGIDEKVLAEQQFHHKREELINEGLSFILRVRRQQSAISTWLGEALQREDGGTG